MPVKKYDVTDQQEEETPKELYYHVDTENNNVRLLHKESIADGEVMGVTESWYPNRDDIMKARAYAHGYTLVERGV